MTTATEITLPPLHDAQLAIAKSDARFKVVCCGRRFGKTMLGVVVCLRAALKGGRVWWVAPTYQQALEGWRYLVRLTNQIPQARTRVSDHTVMLGRGSIQIKTADNPDNLRGSGLDGAVLDEAASMKPEVFDLIIRPALADKQGWAMFPSTPQHFNWFYDLFERGQSADFPDWQSWQHPTWHNPYIAESEIDAARRDMTDEDFEQEFGASFTAVGGAIFRLLSADRPVYLRPMPLGLEIRRTGVGMDWGTTPQHQASVVCDSLASTGAVWRRSVWLDHSGSSDLWRAEALRCKRDYGASFARVDRSQSSELDRLLNPGFGLVGYADADVGNPHVEVRIGEEQSLLQKRALFFDSNAPGMVEHYNRMCAYHRYPDNHAKAGQVVEEEDDDIDAGCYVDSELVMPSINYGQQVTKQPTTWRKARIA